MEGLRINESQVFVEPHIRANKTKHDQSISDEREEKKVETKRSQIANKANTTSFLRNNILKANKDSIYSKQLKCETLPFNFQFISLLAREENLLL